MPVPNIVMLSLAFYLLFLSISWPRQPDDMPGGGWPAVYLRPAVIVALLLGVVGTISAITH